MKFHITTTLVDHNGQSPSTGFVNLYRKADGSFITGKKVYSSEAEASRRSRPAAGWTVVKRVSVADYQAMMPKIEAVARQAAIISADAWLGGADLDQCKLTYGVPVQVSAQVPQEAPAVRTIKRVVKTLKKVAKKVKKKVTSNKKIVKRK